MEWRELIGRKIVAAIPARQGRRDETIPNVVYLRFEDGGTACISCDWASHERPWLAVEEVPPDVSLLLEGGEGDIIG